MTASRGIRVRALTRAQQDEVRTLRVQGLSWKAISDATGIPKSTVARVGQAPDPRGAWDLDRQPYGPAEHGLVKQALGLERVSDTYVMTEDADPFYSGTAGHLEKGQWFGQLWRDLGMPDGTHTRRVHYKANAVGALKPDGTPYLNNDRDWKYLQKASATARYLGLLDVEALTDKRSRGVSVGVEASRAPDGTPGVELGDGEWDGWQVPAAGLPDPGVLAMPAATVTGYGYEVADQPVLVEVWCEKSTMDDVLEPLRDRLGFNLASDAKGYESITHIVELLRRAEDYPARRAVVLYISDNDPAGGNMPVQVARHCQFWAAQLGVDAEVLIHPIVLTRGQVEQYGLPQTTDGKTELDALEALRPGVLARIVEAEVEAWRDPELAGALARDRGAGAGAGHAGVGGRDRGAIRGAGGDQVRGRGDDRPLPAADGGPEPASGRRAWAAAGRPDTARREPRRQRLGPARPSRARGPGGPRGHPVRQLTALAGPAPGVPGAQGPAAAGPGRCGVTASPYDAPLSALRNRVDDLGVWLAIWEARNEPDAHARRCAGDAVDSINAMLRDLHTVRQQLISEIRQADDATAARADALLHGQEGRE